MTKADAPKFAECLAVLSETYNEPVSELRAEAYFSALEDVSIDGVQQAVRSALRTMKFFPKPSELLDLIYGSPEEQALNAWSEVLTEIRRVGMYGKPDLEEPTREALGIVFGTWERLCETLPSGGPELLGWLKHFKAAYVGEIRREDELQDRKRLRAAKRPALIESGTEPAA